MDREGRLFTDMYLLLRQSGKLESLKRGHTENLVEFLDRFMGAMIDDHPVRGPKFRADPSEACAIKQRKTVGFSPACEHGAASAMQQDAPMAPAVERVTRKRPAETALIDGAHVPTHQFSRDNKKIKKTCLVCKAMKRQTPCGDYATTVTYCAHCRGHVHGRDELAYPDCWRHHLVHQIEGLHESGSMSDRAMRAFNRDKR